MYHRAGGLGNVELPGAAPFTLSNGLVVQIAPGPPVRVLWPVPISQADRALQNEAGIEAIRRHGGESWGNVWSDTAAAVVPMGWWVNWRTRQQIEGRVSDAPPSGDGWTWQAARQDFAADDAAIRELAVKYNRDPDAAVAAYRDTGGGNWLAITPEVVKVAVPAPTNTAITPESDTPQLVPVKLAGFGGKWGVLLGLGLALAMLRKRGR